MEGHLKETERRKAKRGNQTDYLELLEMDYLTTRVYNVFLCRFCEALSHLPPLVSYSGDLMVVAGLYLLQG